MIRKPAKWAITPAFVAPEWRRIWSKARLMVSTHFGVAQFDYVRHQLSSVNGTIPEVITRFGHALDFPGGTTTESLQWSGRPTDIGLRNTLAAVVTRQGETEFQEALATSTVNTGMALGAPTAPTILGIILGGVEVINSTLTIPLNNAAFIAASLNEDSNACHFIVKNLVTGDVQTHTTTFTADVIDGNGIFVLGNHRLDFALGWNGLIHMGSIIGTDLSPQELLFWADDPFGPFRMYDEAGVVYGVPAVGGATVPIFRRRIERVA